MEKPESATLNVAQCIRELLSRHDTALIFDKFIESIEWFCNKPCSTMLEMRKRQNKKIKGDIWENFCQRWLQASNKYTYVWLWNEVPPEVKAYLRLPASKQDEGIDIITFNGMVYTAVQCKYRKKVSERVTWKTLSTFVGLCAVSGPWSKCVVMTNCSGIMRKVKTPLDASIWVGSFRSTTRADWMHIAGLPGGNKIDSPESESLVNAAKKLTLDEMREARLKRFGN